MKYYNFLIKLRDTYILGRGHYLEDDSSLAIVRSAPDKPLEFTGEWSIIDVATGYFLFKDKSKKKLLEKWSEKKDNQDFIQALAKARRTDSYIKVLAECSGEKASWRDSGYEIE